MKEWECVQVNHHKDIGKVIEEWERKGWRLHTYQAMGTPTLANHYLLFEKGDQKTLLQVLSSQFDLSVLRRKWSYDGAFREMLPQCLR